MRTSALRCTPTVRMLHERLGYFELPVDPCDAMVHWSSGRHGVYHKACWMLQRVDEYDESLRTIERILFLVTDVPRLARWTHTL
jgi:hypothetical protein